jgi:hypothetical protein
MAFTQKGRSGHYVPISYNTLRKLMFAAPTYSVAHSSRSSLNYQFVFQRLIQKYDLILKDNLLP